MIVSSCRIKEARIESSDSTSDVFTLSSSLLLSLSPSPLAASTLSLSLSPLATPTLISSVPGVVSVIEALSLEFHGLLLILLLILLPPPTPIIEQDEGEEANALDVPLIMAKPRTTTETIIEVVVVAVALVWARHRIMLFVLYSTVFAYYVNADVWRYFEFILLFYLLLLVAYCTTPAYSSEYSVVRTRRIHGDK